MKDKIMIFIIGLLVGAILATGGCIIYNKTTAKNCDSAVVEKNDNQRPGMGGQKPNGEPPEMPSGEMGENGQPPAKPGEENGTAKQPTTSNGKTQKNKKVSKTEETN